MSKIDDLPFFGVSGVTCDGPRVPPVGGWLKRAFDIGLAVIALLSVSFLFVAVIAMIRLNSKGPAIYVHRRVGYGGRSFPCLKFRTMVIDADERLRYLLETDPVARREFEQYRKLKRDPRIIPGIGAFLRTTSLDELPQIINVLFGHMSIVGPRPVTEDEIENYKEAAEDYYRSRPGITGLWQISGRNDLSFEERVRIDQYYIRKWSFLQDIRIILRTSKVVVLRRGAY